MTTPVSMELPATCSSNRCPMRMELPALTGRNALSVHTTIGALEGLRNYELHRGRSLRRVRAAQRRRREFLLIHRLFRSHRTGQVIKPVFTQFSFPPRWHYDILRALDYFQAVNAPYDERLAEAIDIVRRNQGANGSWTLQNTYRGKTYFKWNEWARPAVGTLFARCAC
jgi:hypothetical protein